MHNLLQVCKPGNMTQLFEFEEIKAIQKSVQFVVYGYIRRCQQYLPLNNVYYIIPDLVTFCILFFYNDPECWSINNDKSFVYSPATHANYFHIFGTKKIEKKYSKQYKWRIATSKGFDGTLGLIDATDAAINNVVTDKSLWERNRKDVAFIGTNKNSWSGTAFGDKDDLSTSGFAIDREMSGFIAESDIITIGLDYDENTITFSSDTGTSICRTIKKGIDSLKLVAEFAYTPSTLTLQQTQCI